MAYISPAEKLPQNKTIVHERLVKPKISHSPLENPQPLIKMHSFIQIADQESIESVPAMIYSSIIPNLCAPPSISSSILHRIFMFLKSSYGLPSIGVNLTIKSHNILQTQRHIHRELNGKLHQKNIYEFRGRFEYAKEKKEKNATSMQSAF